MLIIITDNYPLYKFENPEKVVLKELLCFAIFSVDPVSQMFSFDECVLSVQAIADTFCVYISLAPRLVLGGVYKYLNETMQVDSSVAN